MLMSEDFIIFIIVIVAVIGIVIWDIKRNGE
jgi:hypothetical protein